MIGKSLTRKKRLFLGIFSVLIMLIGYHHLSIKQHQINPDDTTIPTWSQFKDGIVKFTKADDNGERWIVLDAKATAYRLFLGLFYGIIGAIIIGFLMGINRYFEAFLFTPISLLAKVPPTAALAVFFAMVGTGLEMYITMIAVGVLPSMAKSIYLSIEDIRDEYLEKARTLGSSYSELIIEVVAKFILPRVIDLIVLQLGPAVVYLIAAEMVVGHVGFGYRIRLESKLLNMNVTYIYIVMLALFGYCMEYGLKALQSTKSLRWYKDSRR